MGRFFSSLCHLTVFEPQIIIVLLFLLLRCVSALQEEPIVYGGVKEEVTWGPPLLLVKAILEESALWPSLWRLTHLLCSATLGLAGPSVGSDVWQYTHHCWFGPSDRNPSAQELSLLFLVFISKLPAQSHILKNYFNLSQYCYTLRHQHWKGDRPIFLWS